MKRFYSILILLLLLPISSVSANYWPDTSTSSKISVDLSIYGVKTSSYAKAALKTFLKRQWQVTVIHKDKIVAKDYTKVEQSPVQIDFSDAPMIHIQATEPARFGNFNYLSSLSRDIAGELLSCTSN